MTYENVWSTPDGRATIHHGDCLDVMRSMPDGSVDAVVTDPPYGLAFMGKAWDHGVPGAAFWTEAARVAKPGAHLLAFGGTRTFHRLACAIEDAGWEIRDCLSWLYGSGFPKSHNGVWGGTALKPAWEPVVMARKPLIGTVAANHAAHGTGALNIDGCRIGTHDATPEEWEAKGLARVTGNTFGTHKPSATPLPSGRWPANVALDDEAARLLDEQSGERAAGAHVHGEMDSTPGKNTYAKWGAHRDFDSYGDSGGASRFFYTAKASRSEREAGLRGDGAMRNDGRETPIDNPYQRGKVLRNHHPTVKPVDLMRWLVRLVTPMGGTVLDPFLGSGTTLVAALQEGCKGVGIEREAPYVEIAKARVAHEAAQLNLFYEVKP